MQWTQRMSHPKTTATDAMVQQVPTLSGAVPNLPRRWHHEFLCGLFARRIDIMESLSLAIQSSLYLHFHLRQASACGPISLACLCSESPSYRKFGAEIDLSTSTSHSPCLENRGGRVCRKTPTPPMWATRQLNITSIPRRQPLWIIEHLKRNSIFRTLQTAAFGSLASMFGVRRNSSIAEVENVHLFFYLQIAIELWTLWSYYK